MRAGVIGIVNGSSGRLESEVRTVQQDGEDLLRSVQVRKENQTSGGHSVQRGQAAIEQMNERTQIEIDDATGDIRVTEKPQKTQSYSEFLHVEDEFVAAASSSGVFVFNLIENQYPEADIERPKINLRAFLDSHPDAYLWQVGFYGAVGNAQKGIVYGDDVNEDEHIGNILDNSQLNQLGLIFSHNGDTVKITMSESGYVEIYQPTNYDELDFADFVVSNIIPHLRT